MAEEKSPLTWFPFYVNDWLGSQDIDMMTAEQTGAYISLLARSFNCSPECCLPNNDRLLQRWSKMTETDWESQKDAVLSKFDEIENGQYLRNEKLWRTYQTQRDKQQQAIDAAKARWEKDSRKPSPSVPTGPTTPAEEATEDLASGGANNLPESHGQGGGNSKPRAYTAAFERFWAAYPNRTGKLAAARAFEKARKMADVDTIVAAVDAHCDSDKWNKEGGRFIPNPATWLNQGRWDDEIEIEESETDRIDDADDVIAYLEKAEREQDLPRPEGDGFVY